MKPGILLIDHLDSFSFNLAESFERLGRRVQVMRSHVEASRAFDIAIRSEALIVLSPGPGRPADAGCYLELTGLARGYLPRSEERRDGKEWYSTCRLRWAPYH